MARISKRAAAQKNVQETVQKIQYKAGIYARLSSDQDTRKNESVDVQIDIAEKYVEDWNRKHTEQIMVVDRYIDLGKTGSNFNRDEFQRLMQDIRLGDINCVIVKDLSRFGRNYLEAGNYIEKIFPFLGVRFIAVADGLDTGDRGSDTKQMATEIKNLVNDMYAKDFSVKAKQHLKQRREAGSYVGGPPPYGYLAGWEGKIRVLQPDENTAELVRYIFERFIQTESYAAVADDLNSRRINPPAIYKKTGEVFWNDDAEKYKGWDKGSVERMIKSRTYTGMLVQGKTSITARDESNRIHKPEENWVVTEHAHEPLVSMEVFRQAEQICGKLVDRTKSHKHPTKGYPIGENIFDNVLYCGVCGRKMTRSSYVKDYADGHKERKDGYFCLNGGQTKVDSCPESNRISKTELVDILLPLLRIEFQVCLGKQKKYVELGRERLHEAEQELVAELAKADRSAASMKEEERRKYMAYREGKIPQKEYVAYKMKQENRRKDMEKRREELEADRKDLSIVADKYLGAIRSLLKLKSGKELTKDMIEALISKIYVYPGKRIEVQFNYTNEMLEGVVNHGKNRNISSPFFGG